MTNLLKIFLRRKKPHANARKEKEKEGNPDVDNIETDQDVKDGELLPEVEQVEVGKNKLKR